MHNMSNVGNRALKTVRIAAGYACVAVSGLTASSAELPYQYLDPAFESGASVLRKTTCLIDLAGETRSSSKADLRLLIGVKAIDGAKRELYYVELTTMHGARVNSTGAAPAVLYTNRVSWPEPDPSAHTNLAFDFVYTLAPLRVRVFDQNARLQKQGQAMVPWELMTNSLEEVCRICVALQQIQSTSETNKQARMEALEQLLGGSNMSSIDWVKVMRPVAGGFLTLGGIFAECVSTPALSEIREKASGVIRLPGAWALVSTVFGGKLDLTLDPRFLTDVAVVQKDEGAGTGPLYRFAADLKNGKRKLISVDFVVGPSSGAEVMLGGIRSIRAVHPTKADREFMAQVLAGGIAGGEKPESRTR